MKKNERPVPELKAVLEIVGVDDEDSPVRGVVELTAEEKAALETEKKQLLGEVRSRAISARDAADAMPVAGRAGKEHVLGDVPQYEPEDDGSEVHLDPRARRAGAPRPGFNVPAAEAVEELETVEILASPQLIAAEEAVEEVNEEITILEKQLADERKAQLAEQQARDAANKIRLDAIRQKREAAQAEAQRLKEEQERLALAQRVQATQLHREQQRAADQADIDTKTARLVARVTPILEAVRTALVEVRELKRQHELSLRALMNLDVLGNDVPVPWDHDARAAFQREVVRPAAQVLKEIDTAVNGYGYKIGELQQLIAAGWQRSLDFPLAVNTALLHVDVECVREVVASIRRDIARVSERLAEYSLPSAPIVKRVRESEPRGPVVDVGGVIPADVAGGVAGQSRAEM